jgi:hypothetical protein
MHKDIIIKAALIALALFLTFNSWSGDVMLIANKSASTSVMTQNEVRNIFTLRSGVWPNGVEVKVYIFPDDNQIHSEFTNTVLGLFPYQLRKIIDRQIYSGSMVKVYVVDSESTMLRKVKETDGAIGYISVVPSSLKNISIVQVVSQ